MYGDVEIWYDEYCEKCEKRGETPRDIFDWWSDGE